MSRVRYAIVGLGSRSGMYSTALLNSYADSAELVGYCDLNQTRMNYWNRTHASHPPVPTYKPERFEEMLREQCVDTVIVTSIDRTHHEYICRAMEAGCDVISEKPMTIDASKCRKILETIDRTGRKLTIAFNYRYAPRNQLIKQTLMDGTIGEVKSVHFEWLLDTRHGADYFRRWHRNKANSGGLMVHKATHHFDLVNWWLESRPAIVFGQGGLVYYGQENARRRGLKDSYARAHEHPLAENDPFALHMKHEPSMRGLYLEAEHEDGYHRDQNVFGEGITIEDDMAVLVRYASGATMSYHVTAYSPWEGFRIAFNGTQGRLEYETVECAFVMPCAEDANRPDHSLPSHEEKITMRVCPHWQKPYEIAPPEMDAAGHGGGDIRLLHDLFAPTKLPDPLGLRADHRHGAISILTGIAANRSFETGCAVRVSDLIDIERLMSDRPRVKVTVDADRARSPNDETRMTNPIRITNDEAVVRV